MAIMVADHSPFCAHLLKNTLSSPLGGRAGRDFLCANLQGS